ncbi:leucine-rich repeat-containing protein 57-like [Vanessa tameamea]|uniref:Leucine-rich repeat-containing protein 57-like n=1 Tax=Vanessa tameamea TaxID=334116 RepID=A0A8B8HHW0_VANTA|nr:leucine-rich repeat-containing protein 57-like [Vanessa tameamea]XP_047538396.1 leucine-rich repeat-containing protein 57-like [Vanessa atalanta]
MGNSGLKQHYETASKTGVLQISNHKLKEIPEEVFTLAEQLRNLDLSKNKIPYIPEDMSMFKFLKQLNVSTNMIHILPESLANLKKLELLNVSFNSLTCLPSTFSGLTNLKQIYLNNNKFKVFPKELLGLPNIEVVDLSNNKMTEIPTGMSKFYAVEFNVSQNEISVLSEDLYQAPRLKILRLEENCLSLDMITPSLLRDSKIHTINIDGNLFEPKQLASLEGYNEYTERYTAMKKKMF